MVCNMSVNEHRELIMLKENVVNEIRKHMSAIGAVELYYKTRVSCHSCLKQISS